MTEQTLSLTFHNPLLTADQVAEILHISRAMAYRLMQQNQIRTVSIGRARRVREEDLADYIEENLSPRD